MDPEKGVDSFLEMMEETDDDENVTRGRIRTRVRGLRPLLVLQLRTDEREVSDSVSHLHRELREERLQLPEHRMNIRPGISVNPPVDSEP